MTDRRPVEDSDLYCPACGILFDNLSYDDILECLGFGRTDTEPLAAQFQVGTAGQADTEREG